MLQFTLNSATFGATLGELNRVINKRASVLTLDNFHVCMDSTGRITMTAMYDTSLRMTKTMQADRYAGSGVFLADAEQLVNAIKGLPEQDITLTFKDGELRINYTGGSISFNAAANAEQYPKAEPVEEKTTAFHMSGKTLIEGIGRVQYAVAKDETRPVMSGVYMQREGERLTFAATDGRVLKYTDITPDFECGDFGAILPTRVCDIIRMSVKTGNQVFVELGATRIRLSYASTLLDARVIEGKYPNYRAVVPANNPHHIKVDRQTLLASVKRVGLFANSSSHLCELRLEARQLSVIGRDDDLFGRSLTEVVAIKEAWSDSTLPEPLRIGVSAMYLATLLQNFGAEVVELQIADQSRAMVVKGDSATTLIMPMLIEEPKEEAEPDEEPVEEEPEAEADEDAA